ncbi:hypothetical protein GOP47_0026102 [Adiantum capillus-veneris]|uniref:Uncharacterized protein n=1 Tax=Adiantum capillus-veneris TaxID=13818 RepID=A0A9D4Z2M7_ADICA|nr:hypothetical protein GOP47_0026102 [Adiantum capillus-veneris]
MATSRPWAQEQCGMSPPHQRPSPSFAALEEPAELKYPTGYGECEYISRCQTWICASIPFSGFALASCIATSSKLVLLEEECIFWSSWHTITKHTIPYKE